jgi:hypothetical protein
LIKSWFFSSLFPFLQSKIQSKSNCSDSRWRIRLMTKIYFLFQNLIATLSLNRCSSVGLLLYLALVLRTVQNITNQILLHVCVPCPVLKIHTVFAKNYVVIKYLNVKILIVVPSNRCSLMQQNSEPDHHQPI